MKKSILVMIGIFLVALSTLLQMIVDYYLSYAEGIPMPTVIKTLVIVAGALALIALIISLKAGGVKHR